jgi:hypothetical protein
MDFAYVKHLSNLYSIDGDTMAVVVDEFGHKNT